MFRETLVVVALAMACQGCDDDSPITVTFRVVDQTGAPVTTADISCYGECLCDLECGGGCFIDGVVSRDGDAYVCTFSDDIVGGVSLEARAGDRVATLEFGRDDLNPTVVLWEPSVTFVETAGILEVTWTPLPPAPGPDWESVLAVHTSPRATVAQPLTSGGVAVYAEDLEDFESPSLDLHATHQLEDGGSLPVLDQDVTNVAVPHVPNVPPSRGAACNVVQEIDVTGGEPIRETIAYAAGECPLTDGGTNWITCGALCTAIGGIVDLGAETPVRRVHARLSQGTVELSRDGVAFEPIENGAPLPAATSARYVRVRDATYLSEVSVFAP